MNATQSVKSAPSTQSAIAALIQKGKSAEGRLRAIHGGSFDIQTVSVSVSGAGENKKVSGVAFKGKRATGDAISSLSVGDAEVLPAYQALVRLAQYLEVKPEDLSVSE